MTSAASFIRTLRFVTTHPLSSRARASAYWRLARWQVASRLHEDVVVDWIDDAKLVVRKGMTGATGNVYCGLHEFADMAFVLHALRPDDLFVDVGANVGCYTVLAAAVCGAGAIAFEPDPGAVAALRRNVRENRAIDRVFVMEAAVGACAGAAHFSVGLDTTNHIVTTAGRDTRLVEVIALDDALAGRDPTVIKIDVEGGERDAIHGARRTLRNKSLCGIILESVDSDVADVLATSGFEPATYDPYKRRLTRKTWREAFASQCLFVRGDEIEARLSSASRRVVAGVML